MLFIDDNVFIDETRKAVSCKLEAWWEASKSKLLK